MRICLSSKKGILKKRKMSCSDFLSQRLGLRLREDAASYIYVSVLHVNRTHFKDKKD